MSEVRSFTKARPRLCNIPRLTAAFTITVTDSYAGNNRGRET